MQTKETAAFTKRVLLSLAHDLAQLTESTERVRVQIHAMAKEYGVPLPCEVAPS